jgi:hypothetical protein
MRLVPSVNIFEFDTKLFQQLLGTAMATRSAQTFANIFLTKVDEKLLEHAEKMLIDDISMIWVESELEFTKFTTQINALYHKIYIQLQPKRLLHNMPYHSQINQRKI